ncbi:hypothetical protein AB0O91_40730 [Kitasatospora sp. NPDC089797]|uniref:hypothetical protein n=1 Tax=Kitasatospora sp. NPDC089797 TaxID=3155298 RepID=UPI00341C9316
MTDGPEVNFPVWDCDARMPARLDGARITMEFQEGKGWSIQSVGLPRGLGDGWVFVHSFPSGADGQDFSDRAGIAMAAHIHALGAEKAAGDADFFRRADEELMPKCMPGADGWCPAEVLVEGVAVRARELETEYGWFCVSDEPGFGFALSGHHTSRNPVLEPADLSLWGEELQKKVRSMDDFSRGGDHGPDPQKS